MVRRSDGWLVDEKQIYGGLKFELSVAGDSWKEGRGYMDDGWEGVGGWMEGDGWMVGWKEGRRRVDSWLEGDRWIHWLVD